MRFHRATASCLALVATAASLHAQTRARTPPLRSLSADVAAAVDHRPRVSLEAVAFSRITVGVSAAYSDRADDKHYAVRLITPGMTCPPDCYGYINPSYRSWSFDVAARWYPAFLSLEAPGARVMAYVGEFVGYTSRRFSATVFCPVCALPVPQPALDPVPWGIAPPGTVRSNVEALEPGLELGVRVIPARHLVLDVGGRSRLVRVDDPLSRRRPGDVETRLVVGVGVGW